MYAVSPLKSVAAYYTGLGLAILSTLFIGVGFVLKKSALIRAGTRFTRAGDGGLVYLRDWLWWLGLCLFALGESANFIAYALAPASLVTPLGGLSVLVSAVMSARFLNERLSTVAKLGCFVCLLGSTLVVLHAPKEQQVNSLIEMKQKFFDRAFVAYILSVVIVAFFLILFVGPRAGRSNPLVYVLISASLGSLSVMACKGLGIGMQEVLISGPTAVAHSWFFWFLLGLLIVSLIIQLYFLNRALDLFNTGLITALLYVFFTGFVLFASAILFREWTSLDSLDYVELIVGLLLIALGVFMMAVFKDLDTDWKGLGDLYSLVHRSLAKHRNRRARALKLFSNRFHQWQPWKARFSPYPAPDTIRLLDSEDHPVASDPELSPDHHSTWLSSPTETESDLRHSVEAV